MDKETMMKNHEAYVLRKSAERMLVFDYIMTDEEFDVLKKFVSIVSEMEAFFMETYEYSFGMRKMRIDDVRWEIGVFDHVPLSKEHKLCCIQICYRSDSPYVTISCGRRHMSLGIDDNNKLQVSLIRWFRPKGTFDYDNEAISVQTEFVKVINKYNVRKRGE